MAPALTRQVGCIVLAAGGAQRFGGEKLLATFAGRPLLQHVIDAACGADVLACTLVLGASGGRIAQRVDARRCAVVSNKRWREGMSASIKCGLRSHSGDDACIIMLGDQPNVSASDLDALIDCYASDPRRIVALRAGAVWGAPALFPRRDFAGLRGLKGDRGAKRYAQTQRERLAFVEARSGDAFADVDTKEDLIRLSGS